MNISLKINQTNQLDYLNIILMIISFIIAYITPWQLLLSAYAILGPAHYLTEISWLHDRNYFTQQKADYIYLIIFAIYMLVFSKFYIPLMILTLSFALAMTLFKSYKSRLLIIFFGTLIAAFTTKNSAYVIMLIFIPSLIHVYLFTAGFILNGALKSKSIPAYVSFVLLLVFGASFFLPQPLTINPIMSNYAEQNFIYFQHIVNNFITTFHLQGNAHYLLQTVRFMAFAYCYHYLNWFSKTRIIKWHEISKLRAGIIIGLYGCALSLYYFSFGLGFTVLLTLSFLHVILELPLDILMFKHIGNRFVNTFKKSTVS